MSVEYIKELGKIHTDDVFSKLEKMYYDKSLSVEEKREVVSSIGRQKNADRIFAFINKNAFSKEYMDVIYQMFRTCLIYYNQDDRFKELCEKMKTFYSNEVMDKMYDYKMAKKFKESDHFHDSSIKKPLLLQGDSSKTLKKIKDGDVHLIFTSPPYYNAREYSDYINYQKYLSDLKAVFSECYRVLEEGRFIVVDVSPVITKRPGREYESIRYPIHFDLHNVLTSIGFYFVDEIIWKKPEPSVPNRIGGYMQTLNPLAYKPNCITESIMVYRKSATFLLDKNIKKYTTKAAYKKNDKVVDRSNVWEIAPSSNKEHPAIFPDELCKKIIKYYSYQGDVVLDPFGGSGTFGRVATEMGRIPVLCEMNEKYIEIIKENGEYDYF